MQGTTLRVTVETPSLWLKHSVSLKSIISQSFISTYRHAAADCDIILTFTEHIISIFLFLNVVFAWEAYERGSEVHLQADPTKLELLHKSFKVKKEAFKEQQRESILEKVLYE